MLVVIKCFQLHPLQPPSVVVLLVTMDTVSNNLPFCKQFPNIFPLSGRKFTLYRLKREPLFASWCGHP